MNLKPKERSQILAGRFPEIVREEPMKLGEIVLKTTKTLNGSIPEVAIVITSRHKTKNGAWEAIYTVRDERGVYVNQGLGYTRSPARALDREAPILDPAVIEAYALEAQQANAIRQGEATSRTKTGRLNDELKAAREKGQAGRTRVLEAKLWQQARKEATFPSSAAA